MENNVIKPIRNSNIELFRIIMMIFIIIHHYIVNSDVLKTISSMELNPNTFTLFALGSGGKIIIDCFILITGYFSCTSDIKLKKWLNLLFQCAFYAIVINSLFLCFSYNPLGVERLYRGFYPIFIQLSTSGESFLAVFLILLLLAPFLNKLIKILSKKEFSILLLILIFVYSFLSTFILLQNPVTKIWSFHNNWDAIGWYCTVYLIGSYIRLYFCEKLDSFKFGLYSSIICLVLIAVSIWGCGQFKHIYNYHFINFGHKTLAIASAISFFIFFKNLKIPTNKFINTLASATLGVLIIHANSGTMRHLLWHDIFKCTDKIFLPPMVTVFSIFAECIVVYCVCVIIALLVNNFITKPLFNMLETKFPKIMNYKLYD